MNKFHIYVSLFGEMNAMKKKAMLLDCGGAGVQQWLKNLSVSPEMEEDEGEAVIRVMLLSLCHDISGLGCPKSYRYISQAPYLKDECVAFATVDMYLLSLSVLQQDVTVTSVAKQVTLTFCCKSPRSLASSIPFQVSAVEDERAYAHFYVDGQRIK
uniref:Uncharacterized protein n=1 Tax=Lepeophtheirus salmonis TaxID=72036 RepID=A0A0K2U6T1_LEPSM